MAINPGFLFQFQANSLSWALANYFGAKKGDDGQALTLILAGVNPNTPMGTLVVFGDPHEPCPILGFGHMSRLTHAQSVVTQYMRDRVPMEERAKFIREHLPLGYGPMVEPGQRDNRPDSVGYNHSDLRKLRDLFNRWSKDPQDFEWFEQFFVPGVYSNTDFEVFGKFNEYDNTQKIYAGAMARPDQGGEFKDASKLSPYGVLKGQWGAAIVMPQGLKTVLDKLGPLRSVQSGTLDKPEEVAKAIAKARGEVPDFDPEEDILGNDAFKISFNYGDLTEWPRMLGGAKALDLPGESAIREFKRFNVGPHSDRNRREFEATLRYLEGRVQVMRDSARTIQLARLYTALHHPVVVNLETGAITEQAADFNADGLDRNHVALGTQADVLNLIARLRALWYRNINLVMRVSGWLEVKAPEAAANITHGQNMIDLVISSRDARQMARRVGHQAGHALVSVVTAPIDPKHPQLGWLRWFPLVGTGAVALLVGSLLSILVFGLGQELPVPLILVISVAVALIAYPSISGLLNWATSIRGMLFFGGRIPAWALALIMLALLGVVALMSQGSFTQQNSVSADRNKAWQDAHNSFVSCPVTIPACASPTPQR